MADAKSSKKVVSRLEECLMYGTWEPGDIRDAIDELVKLRQLIGELGDFVEDFNGIVPGDHLLRTMERAGMPRSDRLWEIVTMRLTGEPPPSETGGELDRLKEALRMVRACSPSCDQPDCILPSLHECPHYYLHQTPPSKASDQPAPFCAKHPNTAFSDTGCVFCGTPPAPR